VENISKNNGEMWQRLEYERRQFGMLLYKLRTSIKPTPSRRGIAAILGVKENLVTAWELSRSFPTIQLSLVAKAYGTTLETITGAFDISKMALDLEKSLKKPLKSVLTSNTPYNTDTSFPKGVYGSGYRKNR
jgi:hypothetical protein